MIFATKNTLLGAIRYNYPHNGSANFTRLIKRIAQNKVLIDWGPATQSLLL